MHGKSAKRRAPSILGTKQSLGTLIEKTTRVGWLKSFILHISGRVTGFRDEVRRRHG
jgi:hypothetical protein